LKADELSSTLINAIKKTYRDREIEITVREIQDWTDYLMSSQANRAHILKAIENINAHKNLVQMSVEDL
jgi:hypothetical protein